MQQPNEINNPFQDVDGYDIENNQFDDIPDCTEAVMGFLEPNIDRTHWPSFSELTMFTSI